jgi:serine/threonine protein kinase
MASADLPDPDEGPDGRDEDEPATSHEPPRPSASTVMFGAAEEVPVIPGHRVVRKIGGGGMGIVYLAQRQDDRFHRTVAVKVIKRGMDSEEILQRFDLERQVLAALNHPNIARLFEGGITGDGRPYFVLEYIEGESIDEYCDSHRLNTAERLQLFAQVCRAVHYAHQNLVVHRDLKPGNILVTRDGVPKLLDFGIAKLLNPDLTSVAVVPTVGALRLMTPEYASPEQVRGKPISTASDVYALGVVLYELLTGHRPYRITTRVQEELERIICDEEPTRPSDAITRVEQVASAGRAADQPPAPTTRTITPETVSKTREGRIDRLRRRLRGDVDNIILKAMQKAPQRRYGSAEQFAQDIENHLKGFPVIARPDSLGYRCSRFVRRHRIGVAVAGLVVLGAAATAAAVIQSQRAAAASARLDSEQAETAAQQARAEQAESERLLQQVRADAEAERADAQALLADERARVVAGMAKDVFSEIALGLARDERAGDGNVPPPKNAIAYLESLADAPDPSIQATLADAWSGLGDLQLSLRGGHLGDRDGARHSHERALAIRQRLLEADPQSRDAALGVIASHGRLGDVLRAMDPPAAGDHYAQASRLLERLDASGAADRDLWRAEARSLANRGDVAAREPQGMGDALTWFERSLALRTKAFERWPDDINVQRDLAVGCGKLAYAYQQSGRFQEAEDLYRRNLALREELLAARPDHASLRRDLPIARWALGGFLVERDRAAEAAPVIAQARAELESLRDANPIDRRVRRDVALILELEGRCSAATGDPDAALTSFRAFHDAAEAMYRERPDDAESQRLLGMAHRRLGDALASTADAGPARAHYESALRLLEPLRHTDVLIAEAVDAIRAALAPPPGP